MYKNDFGSRKWTVLNVGSVIILSSISEPKKMIFYAEISHVFFSKMEFRLVAVLGLKPVTSPLGFTFHVVNPSLKY